jgi:hypothetical protein
MLDKGRPPTERKIQLLGGFGALKMLLLVTQDGAMVADKIELTAIMLKVAVGLAIVRGMSGLFLTTTFFRN